jgi:hypothetical protein
VDLITAQIEVLAFMEFRAKTIVAKFSAFLKIKVRQSNRHI